MTATEHKLAHLRGLLTDMDRVVIAFSGGVDSTFLLKIAVETLGDRAVALTAVSESYPEWELASARALAREMGARMIEVRTHELDRQRYRANAGDRCFHCKTELFEVAHREAAHLDLGTICYGAIPDDLGDHRPGMLAAQQHDIRAPLIDAGLTKAEIRQLSKAIALDTWDKPATACLSSRFPYGVEVTGERLDQVGRCEAGLRALGLRQFRARFHGDLVRVEIAPHELDAVFRDARLRGEIIGACKAVGFRYVALDLEGYRTGSANEALVQIRAS